MENTEKKGLLTRIQDYLDSPKGRILLNYLYSWGAAVVILGALFKLTHIKGANLMLFIGMGTEVLVFFISGFERPYIPSDAQADEDDYEGPKVRGNIIINGTVQGQATPAPASVQPVAAVENTSSLNVGGVEQITQDYIARIHDLTVKMEQMCRHSEKMEQSSHPPWKTAPQGLREAREFNPIYDSSGLCLSLFHTCEHLPGPLTRQRP